METTKILVKNIIEKVGKNDKKYYVVLTEDGGVTCFENSIVEKLKAGIGRYANVVIKESNGFKNLREFESFADDNIKPEEIVSEVPKETKGSKPKAANRQNSFLPHYCKDIMNNMVMAEQHLAIERNDAYYMEKAKQAVESLNIILDTFGGV